MKPTCTVTQRRSQISSIPYAAYRWDRHIAHRDAEQEHAPTEPLNQRSCTPSPSAAMDSLAFAELFLGDDQ